MIIEKLLKRKKGEAELAERTLYYVIVAGIIMLTYLGFIIFVVQINTNYAPGELEQSLHMQRFINNCFAHIDPYTLTKQPGMIDYQLFTDETLKQCYDISDKNVFAYKLTLEGEFINEKRIQTAHFASDTGYDTITYPVIVKDNNITSAAQLHIASQYR